MYFVSGREALDKGRWSTARIGSSYKGHADAREQLVTQLTASQTFHAQLAEKEALIAQLQEELAALSGRCHSKIRELGRYLSIEFCPRGQFESTWRAWKGANRNSPAALSGQMEQLHRCMFQKRRAIFEELLASLENRKLGAVYSISKGRSPQCGLEQT
jgi:hypothetical protein